MASLEYLWMIGVHTSGEPRWMSLFLGWLQTSAIHFSKHLPLEFCFSLSPFVILQKSKITSCGESSCKIIRAIKTDAWKSKVHPHHTALNWVAFVAKRADHVVPCALDAHAPDTESTNLRVWYFWDPTLQRGESYLVLMPHPMLWRTKPFSFPWQNEHVAACLQESFGLALWDAIQDVLNSCHQKGPRSRPLRFVFVAWFATIRMSETPGIPWEKNQPIFFRISDFKNWTQIKAWRKANKSQQIKTNHNKSQQIKQIKVKQVKQITFVNICKVWEHFRVPTPSYADRQDPHRQSHSSTLLTGFFGFEKEKTPGTLCEIFFLNTI